MTASPAVILVADGAFLGIAGRKILAPGGAGTKMNVEK
jgi:hypothetical protein